MTAYLLRRAALGIALLVAVTSAGFWLFATHLNPLYPLLLQQPRQVERINAISAAAHLHDSVIARYWLWIKGIFVGGGGARTVLDQAPIWNTVVSGFAMTMELAVGIVVVGGLAGISIGLVAAANPGSRVVLLVRILGYVFWSTPVFILILVAIEGANRIQRTTGIHPLIVGGPPAGSGLSFVADWFRRMTLPILTGACGFAGLYSRYTRAAVLASLSAPFTTTALGKGLSERRMLVRHALRVAVLPLISVLTLDMSAVLGTTLVVDILFGLGGLGGLFFQTTRTLDPYQLASILSVTVLAVVVVSFVGDVIYAGLDPRITIH
jgi:peptide/nickel transport system permease protein